MTATPDLARIGGDIERGLAAAGSAAGAVAVVLGERTRVFMHGEVVPGEPVVPSTLFHICSCSKTFTAAVFARLVQDGSAAWDERACSVVPEFEFSDPRATAECTFRDLASMRVGLGREGIAEWGIDQLLPREERLARARHMPFVAPFRERFSYSNLCYIALALAAERLGGKPYQDLVRDLVCTPLGLGDSYSAGFGTGVDALAALPSLEVGGKPARVRDLTGPNSEGSARIHLSVRDAGTWMQSLLALIGGSDNGFLSASAVEEMATPHALVRDADVRMAPGGAEWSYGMGLFTGRLHGHRLLRHGGGGRGWRHAMVLAPDAGAGVMVMSASEHPGVEALALECVQALLGESRDDWSTLFHEAAKAAALEERTRLESRFPAAPGAPVAALPPGNYANPVTGLARVEPDGPGMRIDFEDAPDFAATLEPLGGAVFAFVFDEPALARQPLDPPFLLRMDAAAAGPVLHTSHFGSLERTA